MAKKTEVVIPHDYHIVMYTDGGCVPNPGNAGYGVHGYSYRETEVNLNRYRLTKRASRHGYNDDTVKEKDRVYALDVFSAMGMVSPGEKTTNNAAELMALIIALQAAMMYRPSDQLGSLLSIHLMLDSKYVIKLFEFLYKTKRKDEREHSLRLPRQDGTTRPNLLLCIQLLRALESVEKANIPITIDWVKGHSGEFGNEQADVFATMGVRQATQYASRSSWLHAATQQHHSRWCDARSFWRERDDIPALVDHVNVVYSNDLEYHLPTSLQYGGEDYYVYLLSTEANELRAEKKAPPLTGGPCDEESMAENEESEDDDDDDADGKYPKIAGRLAHRKADTTRALVLLREKLGLVDTITSMYRNNDALMRYVLNDIILVKLSKLYSTEFQTGFSVMGTDLVELHDNTLNPTVYDLARASLAYCGDYLAVHVKPQKVSMYMLDQYVQMQLDLYQYLNGHHTQFSGVEDITHLYYTVDEKGKTILRPDRKVGFRRLEHIHPAVVKIEGSPEDDTEISAKMVLVNSIHLPDRNALKRLESHSPKVTLISRQLAFAKNAFATLNFFIVIESAIGFGIYEAEASNLLLTKLDKDIHA